MKPFDYAAFKAAWRQRCADFDIDPAAGATSYQVANVKAEQAKARQRQTGTWWAADWPRSIWEDWPVALDRPPFVHETVRRFGLVELVHRERFFMAASELEMTVIWDIGRQAARLAGDAPVIDVETVGWSEFVDLWIEVRRELLDELTPREREWLPTLAELMLFETGIAVAAGA